MADSDSAPTKFSTSIHITALDGIVNVNSLFTLAVFIGLAWNPYDSSNWLIADQSCAATPKIAEDLVTFHVYSFSSFLFSSLVALGIKQAIRISNSGNQTRNHRSYHISDLTFDLGQINRGVLRVGYLVSAAGSVCGCVFLMLALVNVVQIKLGTLACGSSHSYGAVVPLVILVPSALVIYVCAVLDANICADAMAKLGEYQPAELLLVQDPPAELRPLLVEDIVHLSMDGSRM